MMRDRYLELVQQVFLLAEQCGRDPDHIRVIAVTKGRPVEEVITAYEAGCRDFGENRLEEAWDKIQKAPSDIHWHFIGHLQSKKVNKAMGKFCLIHSVDSFTLAQKISIAGEKAGIVTPILLQANTTGEKTKQGHTPQEWKEKIKELFALPALDIQGLMTMAPYTNDENSIRSCFRNLAQLRNELEDIRGIRLPHLSMGMSNDYRIAIEEGATLLRIGSLLFS